MELKIAVIKWRRAMKTLFILVIHFPITCKDVNNPNLECKDNLKNRENRFCKPQNTCADGCNKGYSHPRRPCLNENYTALIAKAFHDITKCLDVPKERAFAILNHEAQFIFK